MSIGFTPNLYYKFKPSVFIIEPRRPWFTYKHFNELAEMKTLEDKSLEGVSIAEIRRIDTIVYPEELSATYEEKVGLASCVGVCLSEVLSKPSILLELMGTKQKGEIKLSIPVYTLPDCKKLDPLIRKMYDFGKWSTPFTTTRKKGRDRRLLLGILLANFPNGMPLKRIMGLLRGVGIGIVPSYRSLLAYLWLLRKTGIIRILDLGLEDIKNDYRK